MGLKVEDVAPHGYTMDRATIRQQKTGLPINGGISGNVFGENGNDELASGLILALASHARWQPGRDPDQPSS